MQALYKMPNNLFQISKIPVTWLPNSLVIGMKTQPCCECALLPEHLIDLKKTTNHQQKTFSTFNQVMTETTLIFSIPTEARLLN